MADAGRACARTSHGPTCCSRAVMARPIGDSDQVGAMGTAVPRRWGCALEFDCRWEGVGRFRPNSFRPSHSPRPPSHSRLPWHSMAQPAGMAQPAQGLGFHSFGCNAPSSKDSAVSGFKVEGVGGWRVCLAELVHLFLRRQVLDGIQPLLYIKHVVVFFV